jgi:hypothetical protein
MSTDPARLFGTLKADAFTAADPAALRQIGDRRGRVRLTLVATAMVVGVILAGSVWALGRPTALPRPAIPATPPSPSIVVTLPSAGPSTEPDSTETPQTSCQDPYEIPYRAFLQPSDGADPDADCAPPDPQYSELKLCQSGFGGGAGPIVRSISMFIHSTDPGAPTDTTPADYAHQTIMYFKGGGARQYFSQLEAAVVNCPTVRDGDLVLHNRIEKHGIAGDESFLVSVSFAFEMGGTQMSKFELAAVVRVRDMVTVFIGHGWEEASADPALMQLLAKRAVTRLNAWRP